MKFAEDIFPLGTFDGQKTAGAYIGVTLAKNLDVYAEKIIKDMHFLLIITGNDAVGNGKTTLASQVGTYLTWKINQLHGTKNTFTTKNMSFKSANLEKQTLESPKYSVHVLDEGDDLTQNWIKESTQNLKRYFRKCRQLNQILILILPSFFELPKFFALARSHCLINVKFLGNFDRGFFDFYGPKSKKLLYLKGKKEWNYEAHPKDFDGNFFSSYCFFPDTEKEAEKYKRLKYSDMHNSADEAKPPTEREIKVKLFAQIYHSLKDVSVERLSKAFCLSKRTGTNYLKEYKSTQIATCEGRKGSREQHINNSTRNDDDDEG